jgi:hypothetical protein
VTDGIPCPPSGGGAVIGVYITFDYVGDFERARIVKVAESVHGMFE